MRAPAFVASRDELVDLEQRYAELRMRAGRTHVLVMAAAVAGVDADEDLFALEALRPLPQRKQVVERDPDALLERLLVLGSAARNSA